MPEIGLVVFDWAGTTVDFGCFAPVAAFVESLGRFGVELSPAAARGPMGLHKRDHIRALLQLDSAADQWRTKRGADWTEEDVEEIYRNHFTPLQLEVVTDHSQLIPGLLATVEQLEKRGIQIGTTTGYFRAAAQLVYDAAAEQGYKPQHNYCSEDVPHGRPAPWMIQRIMEATNVFPATRVVKVGDTVPDIHEGLNAGAWSIGVAASSSEVGRTEEELAALDEAGRAALLINARRKLLAAGAHLVIDTVADLPAALDQLPDVSTVGT
ncbi:MAG: phosphonoacetaldehyde hydrolase [Pirellulaceae bacterium]|nr:phosphonoacetaldehyde hydrolase [Pirellulaceae bacterium]MDP7016445.1 phosphonoacetaldehyde hydrolase [Pirellulaceae bacterium]